MTRRSDKRRAGQKRRSGLKRQRSLSFRKLLSGFPSTSVATLRRPVLLRDRRRKQTRRRVDRLLFVFWNVQPRRIERERARQRDCVAIFRVRYVCVARAVKRAHSRCVRKILSDRCSRHRKLQIRPDHSRCRDIRRAKTMILNVMAAMLVALPVQLAPRVDVLLIVRRVGELVQMTADGGLRFVLFGPNNGMKSFPAFADVGVASEEIHRAGAEAEQLRHPRVVVVVVREMTVGAVFRRADAARRVREMRIERLTAVTFGGKCLLLRINPFAIRILRTDDDRARRTNHGHAIFLHRRRRCRA